MIRVRSLVVNLLFLAMLVLPGSTAQGFQSQWFQQYGVARSDGASSIALDQDGNVVCAAITGGNLFGTNSGNLYDFVVGKWQPDGSTVWQKQFGTEKDDWVSRVAVNSSNEILLTGSTTGDLHGDNDGYEDVFVQKLNASGNEIWGLQFGTSRRDLVNNATLDSQGNMILCGSTGGVFDGTGGVVSPRTNSFVAKVSNSGNLLWVKQFELGAGHAVAVDSSDNIYLIGSGIGLQSGAYDSGFLKVFSPDGSLTNSTSLYSVGVQFQDAKIFGQHIYVTGASGQSFVDKYDLSGTRKWSSLLGSKNRVGRLAIDESENLYVSGTQTVKPPIYAPSWKYDMFVMKLDSNGNQPWVYRFGSIRNDYGGVITVDQSSNAYIIGNTWGDVGGSNQGSTDFVIGKIAVPR